MRKPRQRQLADIVGGQFYALRVGCLFRFSKKEAVASEEENPDDEKMQQRLARICCNPYLGVMLPSFLLEVLVHRPVADRVAHRVIRQATMPRRRPDCS